MGRFKKDEITKIVEKLKEAGGVFEAPPSHAIYRVRLGNGVVTIYGTGSVVFGGKDAKKVKGIVDDVLLSTLDKTSRIGCDEAGKGEYIGPLVAAAVFCDEECVEKLVKFGVEDSKKLSDKKLFYLVEKIKEIAHGKVKVLMPEEYNRLYAKIGNLNKLLDTVYCELLESILKKYSVKKVIVDKYGPSLEKKLRKFIPDNIEIVVVEKAESDPVVAAASIIARGERLKKMDFLESRYGLTLPRGNKPEEIRDFLNVVPSELLPKLVKLHFKMNIGE